MNDWIRNPISAYPPLTAERMRENFEAIKNRPVEFHQHLVGYSSWNDPKIKTLMCVECGAVVDKT